MSNPAIDIPWVSKHVTNDTLVHGGQCVLHSVVINRADTEADTVAKIHNGLDKDAPVLAIIDLGSGTKPTTLAYDLACDSGIYVQFPGKPGKADLTVVYL